LSGRGIARQHNISHGAIVKKAKKENWQHDLAERVRQRIREKLNALDAIEAKRAPSAWGVVI